MGDALENSHRQPPTTLDNPSISVGDKIRVGEHFWIPDEHIIGWDSDAQHGNGYDESGGSADESCTVTVRGILNDWAVVWLDRDSTPYGAMASIGTVFQCSSLSTNYYHHHGV
jgi:hypothetical protein